MWRNHWPWDWVTSTISLSYEETVSFNHMIYIHEYSFIWVVSEKRIRTAFDWVNVIQWPRRWPSQSSWVHVTAWNTHINIYHTYSQSIVKKELKDRNHAWISYCKTMLLIKSLKVLRFLITFLNFLKRCFFVEHHIWYMRFLWLIYPDSCHVNQWDYKQIYSTYH